jgi:hypothetical protein
MDAFINNSLYEFDSVWRWYADDAYIAATSIYTCYVVMLLVKVVYITQEARGQVGAKFVKFRLSRMEETGRTYVPAALTRK